jgi:hypothetical protein
LSSEIFSSKKAQSVFVPGLQAGQFIAQDHPFVAIAPATCSFFQPLAGWRHVEDTELRTKRDFAYRMKDLVDDHFPKAEVIRMFLDNLNTYSPAALYEVFEPQETLRIVRKLEFHYTPKHGSWLNMAEIEISVLDRQCLDRRLVEVATVRSEALFWETFRNDQLAT